VTAHDPPHPTGSPVAGDPLDRRFTLIRPLGRGGMAEVWLVRDRELGGEVAAKIVPASASAETLALLRLECKNARRLAHPNIIRVFDFHRGDERCFITMAFVEGEDLRSLRGGAPGEILRVLIPVADAVSHAHALGIVHRDLKPENVLRDAAGQPFVLDFGISAVLEGDGGIGVAGSGSRCSMSPQQLDGDEPTPADDLYGFGALLHELVTGHPPLWPEITDERIRDAVPDRLRSSHELPDRLQLLTSRLLAKTTAERPAGMAEVRSELELSLADLQRSAAVSRPAKESIRLTPPPRLDTVRPSVPDARAGRQAAKPKATPDSQRRQLLVTAAIVAPLVILALVVFLFLPRWLEQRPTDATRPVVSDEIRTEERLPEEQARELPAPPLDDLQARPERAEHAVAATVDPADADAEPRRAEKLDEGAGAEREGRALDAERDDRRFTAEMSAGLKALEQGDHASARASLQRAGALRPAAPEVAQALHRVEQAEILEKISGFREAAVEAEEREAWHEATAHYRSILALDPTIRFARRGAERCAALADLSDRLAYHLANPGRLSDDEVFTEATELLVRAAEVDPAGPQHRRQIAEFTRLVETAGTPLPAVLLSDGLTAITVYKVGRFGSFERRELTLRPGRYTVVGSRSGYRDVRLTLEVEPGAAPATLSVKCEEPI
jgi:tetratricopeptide (TPR) repeat protein